MPRSNKSKSYKAVKVQGHFRQTASGKTTYVRSQVRHCTSKSKKKK